MALPGIGDYGTGVAYRPGYSGDNSGAQLLNEKRRVQWARDERGISLEESARKRAEDLYIIYTQEEAAGHTETAEALKAALSQMGYEFDESGGVTRATYVPIEQRGAARRVTGQGLVSAPSPNDVGSRVNLPGTAEQEAAWDQFEREERENRIYREGMAPPTGNAVVQGTADQWPAWDQFEREERENRIYREGMAPPMLDPTPEPTYLMDTPEPVQPFAGDPIADRRYEQGRGYETPQVRERPVPDYPVVGRTGEDMPQTPQDLTGVDPEVMRVLTPDVIGDARRATPQIARPGENPDLVNTLREIVGAEEQDGPTTSAPPEASTLDTGDPYAEWEATHPANLQGAIPSVQSAPTPGFPVGGVGVNREQLRGMRAERRAPWHAALAQKGPGWAAIAEAGILGDQTLEASQEATGPLYSGEGALERARVAAQRPGPQTTIKMYDTGREENLTDKIMLKVMADFQVPTSLSGWREAGEVLNDLERKLESGAAIVPLQSLMLTKILRASGEVRPSDSDTRILMNGLSRGPLQELLTQIKDALNMTASNPEELIPMRSDQLRAFIAAARAMRENQDSGFRRGYDAMVNVYRAQTSEARRQRAKEWLASYDPGLYAEYVKRGIILDEGDPKTFEMRPGKGVPAEVGTERSISPKDREPGLASVVPGESDVKERLKRLGIGK